MEGEFRPPFHDVWPILQERQHRAAGWAKAAPANHLTIALINKIIYRSRMSLQDRLDTTLAAIAHPARREMLARLASGDRTVSELAAPFDMSMPAISRHVKVLERAGLITQHRDAQFRRCTLNVEPLMEIASWTDQYREIWHARFDKMEQCLKAESGEQND